MYGNWQLGNVPVERYVLRHNAFVDAMRAVDSRIRVVAVGAGGKWNDLIVPGCAAHADLLSMHHYSERKLRVPLSPEDLQTYRKNFPAYSGSIAEAVQRMVADLRQRQDGKDPAVTKLKLAIDEYGIVREWNPAPDAVGRRLVRTLLHAGRRGDRRPGPARDVAKRRRGRHGQLAADGQCDRGDQDDPQPRLHGCRGPPADPVPGARRRAKRAAGRAGRFVPGRRGRVGRRIGDSRPWPWSTPRLDRELDVVPRVDGMPAGATVELWQMSGELQAFNTPGQDEQVSVKPLGTIASGQADPPPAPLDHGGGVGISSSNAVGLCQIHPGNLKDVGRHINRFLLRTMAVSCVFLSPWPAARPPWPAPAVAAAGLPRFEHVGIVLDYANLKYNPCNDVIEPSRGPTLEQPDFRFVRSGPGEQGGVQGRAV